MQKHKNRKYFLKILTLLLIFDLILLVPLSSAFYQITSRKMIDSIVQENQITLQQFEYYYDYNRQMTAGICLNIFNNTTAQQLLYSKKTDYLEMYQYMEELRNMKYAMPSSITSVVFFNSTQDAFYSSDEKNGYDGSDLRLFVESQQEIPILQPVLREVSTRVASQNVRELMFSYFIYEASADGCTPSYIVVNQNAGWLIDMLQSYQRTKQKDGSIYYCDAAGMIQPLKKVTAEMEDQDLLLRLWEDTEGELGAFFSREYKDSQGNKYLISGVQVGAESDYIVLLQKYDVIFENLLQLRDSIIGVALIASIMSFVFLLVISSRLYKPVDNLLGSLPDGGGDSDLSETQGEFELIKSHILRIEQKNKNLAVTNRMYCSAMSQYLLMCFVVRYDKNSIGNFCQNYPEHWLVKRRSAYVYMFLLQVDNIDDSMYFNAADSGTVLYSIDNVLRELMPEEYDYASFTSGDTELCVLLGCNSPERDGILSGYVLDCKKLVQEHLKLVLTIAAASGENKDGSLHEMWKQATEYLQYRYIYGHQTVLDHKLCQSLQKNIVARYPGAMDQELGEAIFNMDLSSVEVALVKIYHLLQTYHYRAANICAMSMITKISTVLNDMIEQKVLSEATDILAIYSIALHSDNLDDLFASTKEYLRRVLQDQKEAEGMECQVPLSDAVMDYVQENYADRDLTLQTIAEQFQRPSRNVSKEFKEATGMTINEYITKTRMSVAAHLLRYTDLSINEIAAKIGLENSNYFYKLFKKTYQCTPREFVADHIGGIDQTKGI